VGGDDALVLLRDERTGAFVPAEGFGATLPGGAAWAALMRSMREPGVHRFDVPVATKASTVALCCVRDGIALVFLGGEVPDATARSVLAALPLLATALRAERAHAIVAGQLESARRDAARAGTIVTALDTTRADLERALAELDAQARALEAANVRAEEAASAKDHFLAMLGHELRNPLSPIVTALDLLRRKDLWSREHDVIHRQVRHLLRLVDDLLDVARITRGKLSLDLAPIEAATVIAAAIETIDPLLKRKGQRVVASVPATGLAIDADAARMAQVFSNLLANASKYSDDGQLIEVEARAAGASLVVEVRDRGIGIEHDLLERVFVLFEQQGRGIDRAQGGLGLGLAIVRNLVELHHGTVEARSEGPGRGSCFVVTLPLSAHATMRRQMEPPVSDPRATGSALRVLLVDDNGDALQMLAAALSMAGHAVSTASDGVAALDAARAFDPDVAILDIGLPLIDGYALAANLRGNAGTRRARLVALTGYGQVSDRERSRAAGFDAHLVKPVDLNELFSLLDRIAGGTVTADARSA
ncbi:MAG TPA: ATP-binding protein, partial [Candidatus Saccharimonadia bacterium]|nr:ATP-binding protein [Candidatus Saccharimonadia bacterium]